MATILDVLHGPINEDWESVEWNEQSERMLRIYQKADANAQKAIDEVMVLLVAIPFHHL